MGIVFPESTALPVPAEFAPLGFLPPLGTPGEGPILAVYCPSGHRACLATRLLLQEGFRATNLAGGFRTYQMVTTSAPPETPGEGSPSHLITGEGP
jgi:rhodanese-related sulfurtransferase